MVKICGIGAGYVGGPTMAVIALKCPSIEVAVVDISQSRISAWNSDKLPIYEPGLENVVKQCRGKNLIFSTDVEKHVQEADIIFVSVNTPTKARGLGAGKAADLTYWESAARMIADVSNSDKIVVEKSTVPVRTAEAIERILTHKSNGIKYQILSNPEFLSEGTAIQDLLEPDRVLIGGNEGPEGQEAIKKVKDIYAHWVSEDKIITTNVWSAELSKLADNAFLAQRISSINSMSALCEATGAQVSQVSLALSKNSKLGPRFLNASVGFGVSGKKIAVLGFAFKKDTSDTRKTPAIDVCKGLLGDDAWLSIFDPRVSPEQIKKDLSMNNNNVQSSSCNGLEHVDIAEDVYEATKDAHAICILTEWDEFKRIDYQRVFENMQKPAFVFDGRNILDVGKLRKIGFIVYSIGNPIEQWINYNVNSAVTF
ncbi:UDP-glucose 6-dehydrogenase 3 [Stylosanthes scabra]|uniref:UDP-glucose 6-dehydrogenase n=1 Tax=Stylosanthes scabra TaxID=79078 RepID=A0ABU6XKW1_9FABA|nr:UDP-glucose 6-dehydrogenase 3 [Stylosanthes scabra]